MASKILPFYGINSSFRRSPASLINRFNEHSYQIQSVELTLVDFAKKIDAYSIDFKTKSFWRDDGFLDSESTKLPCMLHSGLEARIHTFEENVERQRHGDLEKSAAHIAKIIISKLWLLPAPLCLHDATTLLVPIGGQLAEVLLTTTSFSCSQMFSGFKPRQLF